MALNITRSCEGCNGTGEVVRSLTGGGTEVIDCPDCVGSGRQVFATSADIEDKLDNLLDKCNDILDKCNDILERVSES